MKTNLLSTHPIGHLLAVQFRAEPAETFSFLTAPEAFARQLLEVREVSEMGNVNTLRVHNRSESFVFLFDGELLQGAKQNRVVNTSILLKPHAISDIPVSCVEAHRWQFVKTAFTDVSAAAPPLMRLVKARHIAKESEAGKHHFMADQGEVWNTVAKLHQHLKVESPTADLLEAWHAKSREAQAAASALSHHPEANGLAIFWGGRLLSLDVFNGPKALREYLPRILRSLVIDALPEKPATPAPDACSLPKLIQQAVEEAQKRLGQPRPSVCAGQERRFHEKGIVGFCLEHESHLIHFNILQQIQ